MRFYSAANKASCLPDQLLANAYNASAAIINSLGNASLPAFGTLSCENLLTTLGNLFGSLTIPTNCIATAPALLRNLTSPALAITATTITAIGNLFVAAYNCTTTSTSTSSTSRTSTTFQTSTTPTTTTITPTTTTTTTVTTTPTTTPTTTTSSTSASTSSTTTSTTSSVTLATSTSSTTSTAPSTSTSTTPTTPTTTVQTTTTTGTTPTTTTSTTTTTTTTTPTTTTTTSTTTTTRTTLTTTSTSSTTTRSTIVGNTQPSQPDRRRAVTAPPAQTKAVARFVNLGARINNVVLSNFLKINELCTVQDWTPWFKSKFREFWYAGTGIRVNLINEEIVYNITTIIITNLQNATHFGRYTPTRYQIKSAVHEAMGMFAHNYPALANTQVRINPTWLETLVGMARQRPPERLYDLLYRTLFGDLIRQLPMARRRRSGR